MTMTRLENGEGIKMKKGKTADKSHIKCYNCSEMGHYKSNFPYNKSKKATTTKGAEKENNMVLTMIEGTTKPKNAVDSQLSCLYTHCQL